MYSSSYPRTHTHMNAMFVFQTTEYCDDGSGFVPVIPLLLDPSADTKEDEVSTFRHNTFTHTHTSQRID